MHRTVNFTPFLAAVAAVSSSAVGLLSWLVNQHVALGAAVLFLGMMIAMSYWRLRRAQATTTRACVKISEQLSSLHSRTGHQFASLSSQMGALSNLPHRHENGDAQLDAVELQKIAETLTNQRALLQEIIVLLDLSSEPTGTTYSK